MLGADAEGCSLGSGQGRYSRNVWNRQEALRFQRQNAAAEKAAEREHKLQRTAAGKAQAEQLNADAEARVARLEFILRCGLDREAAIDLNTMLRTDEFPPLGLDAYGVAPPRPVWTPPPEPRVMAASSARSLATTAVSLKLGSYSSGGSATTNEPRPRVSSGCENRGRATMRLSRRIRLRLRAITTPWRKFAAGLRERDRENVQYYLELALSRTLLPDDVPHAAEVAYPPRGEQAVVRFELPPIDVIPEVESYTYFATTATLRKKERPAAKIARLYRSVIGQITLLYMRNIFDSDPETG
jgi:restriction system protein